MPSSFRISKPLTASLVAGLFAAGLFVGVLMSGLGFLFLFLPTLPLLYNGIDKHPRIAFGGAVIASFFIFLVANLPVGLMFLTVFGLPAWHMARQAVLWRDDDKDGEREWYPVGRILSQLALYACLLVTAVALYYAGQEDGLSVALSAHIRESFAGMQGEYGLLIDSIAAHWSFLVFSLMIWLWGIALYFHLWLAGWMLRRKGIPVRSMMITPFTPPAGVLFLLLAAALASLIGSPELQFLGKSLFIGLMLPYFFCGVALMHEASRNWPSRSFFLFFVYFSIVAQFWPALLLAGAGIIYQLKRLNKGLPPGASSSSN